MEMQQLVKLILAENVLVQQLKIRLVQLVLLRPMKEDSFVMLVELVITER
jgi:hypothetical protein